MLSTFSRVSIAAGDGGDIVLLKVTHVFSFSELTFFVVAKTKGHIAGLRVIFM